MRVCRNTRQSCLFWACTRCMKILCHKSPSESQTRLPCILAESLLVLVYFRWPSMPMCFDLWLLNESYKCWHNEQNSTPGKFANILWHLIAAVILSYEFLFIRFNNTPTACNNWFKLTRKQVKNKCSWFQCTYMMPSNFLQQPSIDVRRSAVVSWLATKWNSQFFLHSFDSYGGKVWLPSAAYVILYSSIHPIQSWHQ